MSNIEPSNQQQSSVEIVFEAQKQQLYLERERKTASFENFKNAASLGTALVFSGTALYGVFSHTIDSTVICALIGAATTLLTGVALPKKGKNNE
jgi:hypothetical protein